MFYAFAVLVFLSVGGYAVTSTYAWFGKMFSDQEYSELQDSNNGERAATDCNDTNAGIMRIFETDQYWCRDYITLVPTSEQYNPADVKRWRDANYASWCGNWIRNKQEGLEWCETEGYVRLMPQHPSYVGDEGRANWLREDKRYLYACFRSAKDATDGCQAFPRSGYSYTWQLAEEKARKRREN